MSFLRSTIAMLPRRASSSLQARSFSATAAPRNIIGVPAVAQPVRDLAKEQKQRQLEPVAADVISDAPREYNVLRGSGCESLELDNGLFGNKDCCDATKDSTDVADG